MFSFSHFHLSFVFCEHLSYHSGQSITKKLVSVTALDLHISSPADACGSIHISAKCNKLHQIELTSRFAYSGEGREDRWRFWEAVIGARKTRGQDIQGQALLYHLVVVRFVFLCGF